MPVRKVQMVPVDEPMDEYPAAQDVHSSLEPLPTKQSKVTSKTKIRKSNSRIAKAVHILLKLAAIKGFDDNGMISLPSGDYTVEQVVCESTSKQKSRRGLADFVQLLFDAKVDPCMIDNEIIRTALKNLQSGNEESGSVPDVKNVKRKRENTDPSPVKRSLKRKKSQNAAQKKVKISAEIEKKQELMEVAEKSLQPCDETAGSGSVRYTAQPCDGRNPGFVVIGMKKRKGSFEDEPESKMQRLMKGWKTLKDL